MTFFIGRLGWLFFNVGVPVFGPVALPLLLSFSHFYGGSSRGIVTRVIQDGQLLWVVISMCASACYEIGCALGGASSDTALSFMLASLFLHALLIVTATVLVSFGAADAACFPADSRDPKTRGLLMWPSLLLTAISTVSFSVSHYWLT
ncbi:hypothetical protein [Paraburkholderia sp. BCC1886]|uniref:hypothetical protein n=1 Tax=Paraburkholderia sp. BCC1886 TaxID=2562670 RepID=UPI001183CF4D|nr:hypothetical protein [Paraburkholderia sp. BCC1886]